MLSVSFMPGSSDRPNLLSSQKVRIRRNDSAPQISYHPNMSRKREPLSSFGHDWYLVEWLRTLRVTQADLTRETGWGKATVNDIYHGKTAYYRQIVNALALALKIEPFELLMHPDEAFRLRRLRDTALAIAAEEHQSFRAAEPPQERLLPLRRKS